MNLFYTLLCVNHIIIARYIVTMFNINFNSEIASIIGLVLLTLAGVSLYFWYRPRRKL